MIVADTSALIAVINDEVERGRFLELMVNDGEVLVSAATAVEMAIVAMGKSDVIYRSAVEFLGRPFIQITSLDEEQLWVAAAAYQNYGKGRRNAAQLNFGDTFSYALASVRGLPLLYKGDDFTSTNIGSAL